MPSYDSELFNVSPYYDDFDDDKKFLRMLFRPGYAVQSRELTQLQTILQSQIEKFGDHIFKDGSVIIGGQITTQTLNFVRILPQSLQTNLTPIAKTITADDVVGYNIIQRIGDTVVAKAKIVDLLPPYSESDNYAVAVISYMSGNEFTAGATVEFDTPNLLYTQTSPTSTDVPFKGKCQTVAVAEGIFYINGFFVKNQNQIQPAYTVTSEVRNFENPTGSMGFDVKQVIVTDRDDYTLRDPANGSYNYNAPGSHRYRIDLELYFAGVSDKQNFFELVRYSSGEVTKKFDQTQYPELVKMFAQRTYDQSGNYVVKPFSIVMKEKDESTLYAEIGNGKAYVYGHEYESAFKDRIEIPKAREFSSFVNMPVQNRFDNYVVGKYKTQLPNGTGPNHTDITTLLDGNPGNKPKLVYGTTGGPIPTTEFLQIGFSRAAFVGLLHSMEFDSTNRYDTIFGSSETGNNFGVNMRAYISSIGVRGDGPVSSNPNVNLNLYSVDPKTGISSKLLFDLNTIRDSMTGSNSLLPQFNNFDKQSLIYQLNGDVASTLIKSNDKISYIQPYFWTFTVSDANRQPDIELTLDTSFRWCNKEGFVPTAPDETVIDEGDEYYLVFKATTTESGTNHPFIGEMLKVRAESIDRVQGNYTINYPQAKIVSSGRSIKFTRSLHPGIWTIIGKVKADNQTSLTSGTKIRKKTLQSHSQTISSSFKNDRLVNSGFGIPYYLTPEANVFNVAFRLNHSDVYKIDSITGVSGEDISYKFEFDSGQRESIYSFGRLHVKPKYFQEFVKKDSTDSEPSYTFVVNYRYFKHEGYGPFVKESYTNSGVTYENIPVFVDPDNGKSINLVNAIDFRPSESIIGYRKRGTVDFTSGLVPPYGENSVLITDVSGGFIPDNYTINSSYTAYLPRIDKIVVSKNIAADGEVTTLRRVPGIANDAPQIPEDLNESMTLSILSVPAYTFNPEDVKAQSIANHKFTMKDISNMSKRVDDLEQHVILSDIEANVVYRDIKKSNGQDAIKRAILVDSFSGHSVGDVLNSDYRCSIDLERGELKPAFDSHAYSMELVGSFTGLTLTSDNILCENFERYDTPVVEQTKASGKTEVNPFGFPNWVGNMVVTPHGDFWFDRDFRPIVKQNVDSINDAWVASNFDGLNGHGSQWNDWESLWTGLSVELTDAESRKNAEFFARSRQKSTFDLIDNKFYNREGIVRETDLVDSNKKIYQVDFRKKDYYTNVSTDTVVNTSVVPYMRDQILIFNAYNLKPNTQVHVFVDNVNMSDICYRYYDNGVTFDLVTSSSITGPFMTGTADGSLTNVVLPIPRGLFEAGERLIRVIDDPNNDVENATTVAEAIFHCSGIKSQNIFDVQSVRAPEIIKQTPNSNKVVSTPLFRRKSINTIKYNNWIDPMAQTFEIRDDLYSSGIFADSVDVFISSKDNELPITIKICPVINGVPHTSVILPFSTVVKTPSEITANSTIPTATSFKFSTPVFLAPGEYAILLQTNSTRYSVFTANIGEKDIITEERISSTLSKGSLFKSQNNSETIGENNTDLMFKLYRCEFDTIENGTKTFQIKTVSEGNTYADSITDISVLQPNLFVFTPDDVTMTGSLIAGTRTYSFSNSRNIKLLDSLPEIDDLEVVRLELDVANNSNGLNTFMIDLDKTNVIAVSYIVTSGEQIQVEENPSAYRPRRKRVKRGASGIAVSGSFSRQRSGKLIFRSIAELGDRKVQLPNSSETAADGVVGTGLSRRGRKKWTYGTRLFVPQYIANSIEDLPVSSANQDDKTSRYITRYVTIPNGLSAKELKVYFDANLPNGSDVKVFAKTYDTTRFTRKQDVIPYTRMIEQPTSLFQSLNVDTNEYSINEYDFREASYSLVSPIPFNTFIIKICMYSDAGKINVPTLKNLRIVAIE